MALKVKSQILKLIGNETASQRSMMEHSGKMAKNKIVDGYSLQGLRQQLKKVLGAPGPSCSKAD